MRIRNYLMASLMGDNIGTGRAATNGHHPCLGQALGNIIAIKQSHGAGTWRTGFLIIPNLAP